MVPGRRKQGTERQGEEDRARGRFFITCCATPSANNSLQTSFLLVFPQELAPAVRHAVRGIVKLFQIAEIEGIVDEELKQRRAQVEKTLPDWLFLSYPFRSAGISSPRVPDRVRR